MPLYLSDSLPALRLTLPDDEFNEYRLRQGRVEFRTNRGVWGLLAEGDVQLHFVLHTEVAKWLLRESANTNRTGSA